ncbi:hypothetical protein CK203_070293 [Vitis vinifera]|uniref:Uncharacterized protein n=1 Tax=Vitis vinifera TaxID=29760 RepID=A0A438E6J6_VITVI|nr:hypothetical protein CK203_070293 [Vitis vinifera]
MFSFLDKFRGLHIASILSAGILPTLLLRPPGEGGQGPNLQSVGKDDRGSLGTTQSMTISCPKHFEDLMCPGRVSEVNVQVGWSLYFAVGFVVFRGRRKFPLLYGVSYAMAKERGADIDNIHEGNFMTCSAPFLRPDGLPVFYWPSLLIYHLVFIQCRVQDIESLGDWIPVCLSGGVVVNLGIRVSVDRSFPLCHAEFTFSRGPYQDAQTIAPRFCQFDISQNYYFSAPDPLNAPPGPRQVLAVRSWLALSPYITVVLFSRDPSVVVFARAFGSRVSVEPNIDFT